MLGARPKKMGSVNLANDGDSIPVLSSSLMDLGWVSNKSKLKNQVGESKGRKTGQRDTALEHRFPKHIS